MDSETTTQPYVITMTVGKNADPNDDKTELNETVNLSKNVQVYDENFLLSDEIVTVIHQILSKSGFDANNFYLLDPLSSNYDQITRDSIRTNVNIDVSGNKISVYSNATYLKNLLLGLAELQPTIPVALPVMQEGELLPHHFSEDSTDENTVQNITNMSSFEAIFDNMKPTTDFPVIVFEPGHNQEILYKIHVDNKERVDSLITNFQEMKSKYKTNTDWKHSRLYLLHDKQMRYQVQIYALKDEPEHNVLCSMKYSKIRKEKTDEIFAKIQKCFLQKVNLGQVKTDKSNGTYILQFQPLPQMYYNTYLFKDFIMRNRSTEKRIFVKDQKSKILSPSRTKFIVFQNENSNRKIFFDLTVKSKFDFISSDIDFGDCFVLQITKIVSLNNEHIFELMKYVKDQLVRFYSTNVSDMYQEYLNLGIPLPYVKIDDSKRKLYDMARIQYDPKKCENHKDLKLLDERMVSNAEEDRYTKLKERIKNNQLDALIPIEPYKKDEENNTVDLLIGCGQGHVYYTSACALCCKQKESTGKELLKLVDECIGGKKRSEPTGVLQKPDINRLHSLPAKISSIVNASLLTKKKVKDLLAYTGDGLLKTLKYAVNKNISFDQSDEELLKTTKGNLTFENGEYKLPDNLPLEKCWYLLENKLDVRIIGFHQDGSFLYPYYEKYFQSKVYDDKTKILLVIKYDTMYSVIFKNKTKNIPSELLFDYSELEHMIQFYTPKVYRKYNLITNKNPTVDFVNYLNDKSDLEINQVLDSVGKIRTLFVKYSDKIYTLITDPLPVFEIKHQLNRAGNIDARTFSDALIFMDKIQDMYRFKNISIYEDYSYVSIHDKTKKDQVACLWIKTEPLLKFYIEKLLEFEQTHLFGSWVEIYNHIVANDELPEIMGAQSQNELPELNLDFVETNQCFVGQQSINGYYKRFLWLKRLKKSLCLWSLYNYCLSENDRPVEEFFEQLIVSNPQVNVFELPVVNSLDVEELLNMNQYKQLPAEIVAHLKTYVKTVLQNHPDLIEKIKQNPVDILQYYEGITDYKPLQKTLLVSSSTWRSMEIENDTSVLDWPVNLPQFYLLHPKYTQRCFRATKIQNVDNYELDASKNNVVYFYDETGVSTYTREADDSNSAKTKIFASSQNMTFSLTR